MTEKAEPNFVILHQYDVDPEGDTRTELWPEYVPKLKEIPGFVAVYTFDDPDAKEGVSLTFWRLRKRPRPTSTAVQGRNWTNWRPSFGQPPTGAS